MREKLLAKDDADKVYVDCNLKLAPTDVVTKTLTVPGVNSHGQPLSGITIDCNGAKIDGSKRASHEAIVVRSNPDSSGNVRGAQNITVRNCKVVGRVRVAGVGLPGGVESTYDAQYTQKLQAISPKDIVFDRLDIEANGPDPFYVFPGALRVTLMNSKIGGWSNGVAIYLDAESAENRFINNGIGVRTEKREQIAIDGSARNLIVGNWFSQLNNAGILIYRNCGEKRAIRHQFPEDNVILDNIFFYRDYKGPRPAVWIASRQNEGRSFCNDDKDGPKIGSNLDNLDHAKRTVVARNRFIGRDPNVVTTSFGGVRAELLKVDDDPSYVFDNVRDDQARKRPSPCYVANGYPSPFVSHGKSVRLFDDGAGPRCTGQSLSCNNGKLVPGGAQCAGNFIAGISVAQAQCRADGNNNGCAGRAACPSGTSPVAIKAACNLESGSVSDDELAKTPWSFAGVVRRSDKMSEGVCVVGGVDVSERGAVLRSPARDVAFSCREHDDNGGDCHVRVALACAPTRPSFDTPLGVER